MSAKSPTHERTVLITGCSDGSLGAGLALAFHKAGFHVYATARNPAKMAGLRAAGIDTRALDVLSSASIAACAASLPPAPLDILVNNAGTNFLMPLTDLRLADAKALFDLNVWSYLEVTQAFLPLLLLRRRRGRSTQGGGERGMVLNQTSAASVTALPFQGAYNASKAAMASFSETMRMELAPFGVQVIELKTSMVKSNMITDTPQDAAYHNVLPEGSLWTPAKDIVERTMRGEAFTGQGWQTDAWAESVVKTVLKRNPPLVVYGGEGWWATKLAPMLPHGSFDGFLRKFVGLDKAEEILKKHKNE